ncbi:enoyl-CoA hydratase/isomerase family protein [Sphingopyxis sp. PET50]|uniref:enoyl-CoA hydratase/isomerase family protein n=1 Tax=Sphingopyxis sp. PET50 TaxID=2976533 RepID=UPI0021AF3EBA|nr:enoyl-CoA hydratase-related protein [Sphingopyxis sp. PET50]
MPARYANYSAIRVGQDGLVLTITLDNPPLNGMTPEAHEELTRIWADARRRPRRAGDRLHRRGRARFLRCSGDPKKMIDNWGNRERWHVGIFEARAIIVAMLECPKPVIARINGHAMGMGASLALAADITIAVEDALIGDPHVSVGLAAGDGGALLWPQLVGLVEARRHLLSGDPLRGKEAAAKGLVTDAVTREELDGAVKKWVDIFLSKSPSALQTTKQALNLDILDKARRHMGEMLRLETRSWESPNHREAVQAMIDKRPPDFVDE